EATADLFNPAIINYVLKAENVLKAEKAIVNGADVNAVNDRQRTPLHYAAENNAVEFVDLLLKAGAKVNAVDIYQKTPLRDAANNEAIEVVDLLLKAGANVNAVDIYQKTPLHDAAINNAVEVVDLLLQNGADVNAVNLWNETPLDYAISRSFRKPLPSVVKLLLNNGAEIPHRFLNQDKIQLLDTVIEEINKDRAALKALWALMYNNPKQNIEIQQTIQKLFGNPLPLASEVIAQRKIAKILQRVGKGMIDQIKLKKMQEPKQRLHKHQEQYYPKEHPYKRNTRIEF
ncbi:ankyrin repeat domain-containing protein, partial [Candidatus Babeliales bacterium]|nr:ankyrin repeat domain-containing protein [Candidatus Babeliales bacterium]